jgi:hypothetical protein
MTGALDGVGKSSLMFCACASLAAWADLAFFGCETAQDIDLFIIDCQVFIGAELANLGTRKVTAFSALFAIAVV